MSQKKYFVSYANGVYKKALERITKEAKQSGFFDVVQGFTPNTLDKKFRQKYKNILNMRKGGGYWIWKIDIIRRTLAKMKENDILVYLDAGCKINKNGKKRFLEYVDMLNKHKTYGTIGMQLERKHPERKFTNEKMFEYFGIKPNNPIRNAPQTAGGILIMKKNAHSMKCINAWVRLINTDPHLITNKYNKYKQTRHFKDHRHDQSAIGLIFKKHGCILMKDETYPSGPTKWGELKDKPFHARRSKH